MNAWKKRKQPRKLRIIIAIISGGLALTGGAAVLLPAVVPASASSSTIDPRNGMSAAMASCQKAQASAEAVGALGRQCNPVAASKLQFNHPDPAGVALEGERQILAHIGWKAGDRVGISRMTYQAAHILRPELAADTGAVAARRVMWVVTLYFPKPVAVPYGGGMTPPGDQFPATVKISSGSFVIDALTGQTLDSCAGCTAVPASLAATRIAAAVASAG